MPCVCVIFFFAQYLADCFCIFITLILFFFYHIIIEFCAQFVSCKWISCSLLHWCRFNRPTFAFTITTWLLVLHTRFPPFFRWHFSILLFGIFQSELPRLKYKTLRILRMITPTFVNFSIFFKFSLPLIQLFFSIVFMNSCKKKQKQNQSYRQTCMFQNLNNKKKEKKNRNNHRPSHKRWAFGDWCKRKQNHWAKCRIE